MNVQSFDFEEQQVVANEKYLYPSVPLSCGTLYSRHPTERGETDCTSTHPSLNVFLGRADIEYHQVTMSQTYRCKATSISHLPLL